MVDDGAPAKRRCAGSCERCRAAREMADTSGEAEGALARPVVTAPPAAPATARGGDRDVA